jgi:hypothetical protein
MSYERARKAIHLQPTEKIALFELIEDPRLALQVSGIDPREDALRAFAETYKRLEVDLIFPHTLPETKRVAEADDSWGVSGIKPKTRGHVDFQTGQDVIAYDPAEWIRKGGAGVPLDPASPSLIADMAECFYRNWKPKQDLLGDDTMVPGTWGFTLYHWLQNTFSLELTCLAATDYPDEFRALLERFAEVSSYVLQAWALLPIELLISHDDLAMQRGLVFRPQWYRDNIISWYAKLWEPLKRRGIKILYWSDGDYSAVLDDILACGADGFMIEPMIDLVAMVDRYGGSKFIVGNANSAILSFGTEAEVEAEVRRCVETAGRFPGYFLCATGSITHTMPAANVEAYFRSVAQYRDRSLRA